MGASQHDASATASQHFLWDTSTTNDAEQLRAMAERYRVMEEEQDDEEPNGKIYSPKTQGLQDYVERLWYT